MKKIITISREYAAGGRKIAKLVAEQLNIPYYDKDIVKETAKASGFEPELVESEGEAVSRTDSILKTICSASSLQFNDTQEVIYTSNAIPVGSKIETAPLDVDLEPGQYECTALFHNLDPVSGAVLGTAGAIIYVTVQN